VTISAIFLFFIISIIDSICLAQIFVPVANWQCQANKTTLAQDSVTVFNQGTFSNTTLSGSNVTLSAGQTSGTYTSSAKDLFGGCGGVPFTSWLSHSWKSTLPFMKELPATASELAADYSDIVSNLMTGLIGYWRFNETTTGTAPGATDFRDFSGNNRHATRSATSITLNAVGRFNGAISSNNTGGYVDLTGVNTSISSTGSYTISVWLYVNSFTNGCGGSGTYFLDRAAATNPLAGICARAGNVFAMETRCDSGASLSQLNGGAIVVGTWQHVVIQRDRTNALYRIFTGGTQIASAADAAGCAVTLATPRLGRHATNGTGGLNGRVDEVAFWNRALSATEIQQIYRRGANRLQFQIRSCTLPDCSDAPTWKGPDGTNATFFSELNNNSTPSTGLGLVVNASSPTMTHTDFLTLLLPSNRYFQYQALMSSDTTSVYPNFNSFTVNR
jgi:hypothetical protein